MIQTTCTHIYSRVLAPLEIMQRYLNPELFKED